MRQQTFDRQQELLAEAARRRLFSSDSRGRLVAPRGWSRWPSDPGLPCSESLAHREISVDRALSWLDGGNGHRSVIL